MTNNCWHCEIHSRSASKVKRPRIAVAGSSSTSLVSSRFSAAPIFAEASVAVANSGGNGVPHALQISHAVSDQIGGYSAGRSKEPEEGHDRNPSTDARAEARK